MVSMKDPQILNKINFWKLNNECFTVWADVELARLKTVLDEKYEPTNLEEVMATSTHLSTQQQALLLQLLKNLSIHLIEPWVLDRSNHIKLSKKIGLNLTILKPTEYQK